MKKEILLGIAFLAVIIGSFFIGYESYSPRLIVKTSTVTDYSFFTTTSFVTKTVYALPEKSLNTVLLSYGSSVIVQKVGSTTYLVLPSQYFFIGADVKTILEMNNPEYLSLIVMSVEKMGITVPSNITDWNSWGSFAMEMTRNFEYDSVRMSKLLHGEIMPSYLPDTLIKLRSGICGDFAYFYAALFLARGYTVTFVGIVNSTFGHAAIEVSGIAMQNNIPGTYVSSFYARWYQMLGNSYTVFLATIAPSGEVKVSSTIISTGFKFPKGFVETVSLFTMQTVEYSFVRGQSRFTLLATTWWGTKSAASTTSYSSGYLWVSGKPTFIDYTGALVKALGNIIYPLVPITVMGNTTVYFTYGGAFYAYGKMVDGTFSGYVFSGGGLSLTGKYSVSW